MKQKMHMTDLVIQARIAYALYAVPLSYNAIKKSDKHIIKLYRSFYDLPNNMPNITIQLPHQMFGIEAFSLTNANLKCIGEQLRDAFNNPRTLGTIYQGLTHFIIAKHGGTKNIFHITNNTCACSPITRTLCLLKPLINIHIRSTINSFSL